MIPLSVPRMSGSLLLTGSVETRCGNWYSFPLPLLSLYYLSLIIFLKPNESILHEFVHDKPWEEYCEQMSRDGCWGDHLTLLAISELFGAVVSIMSSVEGDNFITEIHPTVKKVCLILYLH